MRYKPSSVRPIWITPDAEDMIVYCARVSSSRDDVDKLKDKGRLLQYLITHDHWSPFEMASLCVEINTSRAIGRQILRHRSFSFQEFSQRYSVGVDACAFDLREQGKGNRQSSEGIVDGHVYDEAQFLIDEVLDEVYEVYHRLLEIGVARESARFILPECMMSKMYMTGSIRSWVHYTLQRTKEDTQYEHRQIAGMCRDIVIEYIPSLNGLYEQR